MRIKAKSSSTPYPLWVEGEYITKPPIRPNDGAVRPEGNYIDKGGYPGANVYEISIETLCRDTGTVDRLGKTVYERDILLWETEEEIGYFIIEESGQAVDVINGEILEVWQLKREEIKVIGNVIDSTDFIEGIRHYADNNLPIPYLPYINIQATAYPYFLLKCEKCNSKILSCMYKAHCPSCGGYVTTEFATKVYREKEKALA